MITTQIKPLNYLNTRLVGILRTKPKTPKENAISAIQTAFDVGAEAVEITSNSDFWQDVVDECIKRGLNIGVGSIKNHKTAKEAINHGARFLVSPGIYPDTVTEAQKHKIPILPGVYLKEDTHSARKLGILDQKFFPANVKSHSELYKAISEPFRDEFNELKQNKWILIAYDSEEFSNLGIKNFIEINSPTEFYKKYLSLKNKPPYSPIIIKLPEGKVWFDRLKEISDIAAISGIRTYAVGGINTENMKEVLTKYSAYGVCPGSGMFNADAIFDGDYERVKVDVKRHVNVIGIICNS